MTPMILILCSYVLYDKVNGYQQFQQKIPNGEIVPHPCKPNSLWRGVGHENVNGRGPRNAFGLDFQQNNLEWNLQLCQMDSDGDGKTNGEELGDPDCEWTAGKQPNRKTGLSHPGICNPIDSSECGAKPDFVECNQKELKCPNLEDASSFTMRLDKTRIPPVETTYMCQDFVFPKTAQHLIAFKPYLDNIHLIHHITIFGCQHEAPKYLKPIEATSNGEGSGTAGKDQTDTFGNFSSDMTTTWVNGYSNDTNSTLFDQCRFIHTSERTHNTIPYSTDETDSSRAYKCGMVPRNECIDLIAVWSLGMSGYCMNKDCGILVGGTEGYKWAAIQVHWNNPGLLSGQNDSSGIVLYLTPKLRPFNAGILTIGQTVLAIPPGEEEYMEWGQCDAECTQFIIHDDIKVISVYNHMHYLGKAQTTEIMKGDYVQKIADDRIYNYDDPVLHEIDDGVIVKPGDELRTTCLYKSTSRQQTTYFGDETNNEMCYSFLTYFPAENAEKACLSVGRERRCKTMETYGCDMRLLDTSYPHPKTMALISSVQKLCTPGFCRDECLAYVREAKKDPCFHGESAEQLRKRFVRIDDFSNYFNVLLGAFDSCDVKLLEEAYRNKSIEAFNQASTTGKQRIFWGFTTLCILVVLYEM